MYLPKYAYSKNKIWTYLNNCITLDHIDTRHKHMNIKNIFSKETIFHFALLKLKLEVFWNSL